jgi:hypothetical protein
MDEVRMEESAYPKTALSLAIVVTLVILSQVVIHWHGLDLLMRFTAILFLASLVLVPVQFIRGRRRGRPLGNDLLLGFAYVWVLLTTLVFGLR